MATITYAGKMRRRGCLGREVVPHIRSVAYHQTRVRIAKLEAERSKNDRRRVGFGNGHGGGKVPTPK